MATFSELVDRVVVDLRRPDQRSDVVEALNATIREMHSKSIPDGAVAVHYSENLIEEEFTPSSVDPCLWQIPKPALFMGMESAYCKSRNIQYVQRTPRTAGNLESDMHTLAYYYRTGSYLAFAGAFAGGVISLAYYTYLPGLRYIAPAFRVVITNLDGDYERQGGGLPLTEAELVKETNWLLTRHEMTLREGALAKMYRRLNDLDRAKMFYSSYETMKSGVQRQESTG